MLHFDVLLFARARELGGASSLRIAVRAESAPASAPARATAAPSERNAAAPAFTAAASGLAPPSDAESFASLAAVRAAILDAAPALAPLLPHCALAVNGAYADERSPSEDASGIAGDQTASGPTCVRAGDEIAVLPPVSGG
jgi:hypothetical protein